MAGEETGGCPGFLAFVAVTEESVREAIASLPLLRLSGTGERREKSGVGWERRRREACLEPFASQGSNNNLFRTILHWQYLTFVRVDGKFLVWVGVPGSTVCSGFKNLSKKMKQV